MNSKKIVEAPAFASNGHKPRHAQVINLFNHDHDQYPFLLF
jgi:hypothetical protein